MPGVTYSQLMQVPQIMKVISRYHNPGTTLSTFYNLRPGSSGVQTIKGRSGQYDIFDGTRSLAPVASPMSGPTRIARKQIGSQPITVCRTYTVIGIEDEYVYNTRQLGGQYGTVDAGGRAYIARQAAFARSKHDNNHEFMAAHMFRGGWSYVPASTGSQEWVLGALSASGYVINNDTLVPAGNMTNVSGLIDVAWSNTGADLIKQLMQIQVRAARINGRTIKHIWVNGNTGQYLFKNTVIQAVGGSVYRIFDTLNPAREIGPNQKFPDTGVTVIFRGLPDYQFHIYNQGYVTPGTAETLSAQTDSANFNFFIPDNVAIMTPDPGDWCGLVLGTEPVQYSHQESPREQVGFGMGIERCIDPPRSDIKMLNNAAPVLTEPNAVYYATVIF